MMEVGEVIGALVGKGVREFVVCPGAHDAVIVEVLVRLEERGVVRLWSHFEERGAGFFALGRTMTGVPCGVVTTSGTAVAELLPAVVEAHYQARPLVVVTRGPAAAVPRQRGAAGDRAGGVVRGVCGGGGRRGGGGERPNVQHPNRRRGERRSLGGGAGGGRGR